MDIRTLPDCERGLYNNLKERYSLHFESLNIKKTCLRILKISDIEELLDGADPFSDVGSFPFWARLWESSIVLAHILVDAPERQGGNLLELGAGLGVAGLAASAAGFDVTLTDNQEIIFDFQKISAAASAIEGVEHRCFDIFNPPETTSFSVIAGAELLFKEEYIDPLLNICKKYLKKDGTVYLANDARRKCLPLFLKKAEADFAIGTRKQTIRKNNVTVDVLVNRLKRK